jgi:hypothetical protein
VHGGCQPTYQQTVEKVGLRERRTGSSAQTGDPEAEIQGRRTDDDSETTLIRSDLRGGGMPNVGPGVGGNASLVDKRSLVAASGAVCHDHQAESHDRALA